MKTLIEVGSFISKFVFADDVEIVMGEEFITTPEFMISIHYSEFELIENITIPDDWEPCAYKYVYGEWHKRPPEDHEIPDGADPNPDPPVE